MRHWLLLPAALAVTAASALTVMPAPPWVWAWKLAIAAGEFGQWFVAIPVALGAAAAFLIRGGWRVAVVVLCAAAAACLLRPEFTAARMASELPMALERALGPGPIEGDVFRWPELYRTGDPSGADMVTETYARPEGHELRLDFYRPRRRLAEHHPDSGSDARPPCVVVIHGGGWDAGDRTQLAGWNHRLALEGYAVASIDYRLAPGSRWPAPKEDTLAALAWLKRNADRLGFDPASLVLLGRSAGAQIAEVVAYTARDPAIRGLIAIYGPSDLVFGYENTVENDTIGSRALMRAYLGGTPAEQRTRYEDASALGFVTAASPPTLLVHGYLDMLAWHRHDERLAVRLADAGVRHYFLSLPWATHGFDYNLHGPGGQLTDYAIRRFLAAVTGKPAGKR